MKYAVEGQELTDIADALRRRWGEGEPITVTAPAIIEDDTNGYSAGFTGGRYDYYTIEGATTMYVTVTYQTSGEDAYMQFIPGYVTEVPEGTEKLYGEANNIKKIKYYEFKGTDTVTTFKKKSAEAWGYGFYVEIIGSDENGNFIGDGQLCDVQIFNKNTFQTSEMAQAINDIPQIPPEESFVLTDDCYYRFYKGGWDWFINLYGDKITTKDISDTSSMFSLSKVTEIPFVINMKKNVCRFANFASSCSTLTVAPTIKLNLVNPSYGDVNLSSMFYNCFYIKDFENVFNPSELDALSNIKITGSYSSVKYDGVLSDCRGFRKVPSWWYKLRISEESTAFPAPSYCLYYNGFTNCSSLDEINNLIAQEILGELTSNMFSRTFTKCSRAKNITFETHEDGTPNVVKWKSQIIEMHNEVGWVSSAYYVTSYSGIASDKEVKDDATYQALKDDPDWFTCKVEYSRYNHDSAVATINSLPDTSAYLAEKGGTNTIKFKGAAGSATDGGAINTLTEEEIAVATAKGWTVSLV